jgi:hypothetical protein
MQELGAHVAPHFDHPGEEHLVQNALRINPSPVPAVRPLATKSSIEMLSCIL